MTRFDMYGIYGDEELNLSGWEQAYAEGRPARRAPRRRPRVRRVVRVDPSGNLKLGVFTLLLITAGLAVALSDAWQARQRGQRAAPRTHAATRAPANQQSGPKQKPAGGRTPSRLSGNGGRENAKGSQVSPPRPPLPEDGYLPRGWSRGVLANDTPLYALEGAGLRLTEYVPAGTHVLIRKAKRGPGSLHAVVGRDEEISGFACLQPSRESQAVRWPIPPGWHQGKLRDGRRAVIRDVDAEWIYSIFADGEEWGYVRRSDLVAE